MVVSVSDVCASIGTTSSAARPEGRARRRSNTNAMRSWLPAGPRVKSVRMHAQFGPRASIKRRAMTYGKCSQQSPANCPVATYGLSVVPVASFRDTCGNVTTSPSRYATRPRSSRRTPPPTLAPNPLGQTTKRRSPESVFNRASAVSPRSSSSRRPLTGCPARNASHVPSGDRRTSSAVVTGSTAPDAHPAAKRRAIADARIEVGRGCSGRGSRDSREGISPPR